MIPNKINQRYTTSRQLIAGSDMNSLNDQLNSAQSTTALGTTQATAALINSANVEVKSGSANNAGMVMPVSYPGLEVDILNNSLNTTKIYPNGTDQIQTLTTHGGDQIQNSTKGSSITLQDVAGSWYVVGKEQGTWSNFF